MIRRLLAGATALIMLAGCDLVAGTSGPAASSLPEPQAGWPIVRATVGDRPVSLILAEDHRHGMRGLTGLPTTVQGMLFWYDELVDPSDVVFTMRGLTIDLDAYFFDQAGVLVDEVRMTACPADPCPAYGSSRPFVFVVEAPAGSLTIPPGDRVELLDPVGGL
jgi:uncharacterized membrane protein (UPF0127 family)